MADTLLNKRGILSDLGAKWKSKNVHRPKSRKIFAIFCAKMSKLTFGVGITRGKNDGYQFKVFADHHGYCPRRDRRFQPDRHTALMFQ
ncbi:hypothetical protein [Klebsiella variicola]|uniref:hypothetical protein n=1 Tax=Klebsiella variicola TaxID=244366 RepID=UPI003D01FDD4